MPEPGSLLPALEHALGRSLKGAELQTLGGGCINQALRIRTPQQSLFVKLNQAHCLGMFEQEADGLRELTDAQALRAPQVLGHGLAGNQAFLALEYLPLKGQGDAALAGELLAQQHRINGPTFGWHRDNTLGATPQPNRQGTDWAVFWREQRLGHQLDLARDNGHGGSLQTRGRLLMERLPALLAHQPSPSLLHGDLWSGNLSYLTDGQPVIYDPAVYWGDRECDLAMTELFGGFPARFYDAYRNAWPLQPGYGTRRTLYNLYHILNHLNLFGGGYGQQALSMIDRLLAETQG